MDQLCTGLEGKTVIITGASGGIGRDLALEFAKQGAHIFLTGRNLEELETTKKMAIECSKLKEEQVYIHTADLSIPEECEATITQAVEKFGKLDVLVNNAGLVLVGTIETQTLDQYDAQMNLNARSVFVMTQAAIPHLKETKGNVINISSMGGMRTFSGLLGYSVSKSALNHLTKCSARDLAAYGVRCNSVNPAAVRLPIKDKSLENDENVKAYFEHLKSTHALGRVAEVEDVAKAVIFLASDALSGFITGINLPVDGGASLLCMQ